MENNEKQNETVYERTREISDFLYLDSRRYDTNIAMRGVL